jgi:glycosyltransferase involved in cell wall biosynthesis
MKVHCVVIVPAHVPTGPVKGAYALANSLVGMCEVTLVSIKFGGNANARLDPRVRRVDLAAECRGSLGKVRRYKKLISDAASRSRVVTVSYCLSADVFNIAFSGDKSFIICSVRGNLFENYKFDYGFIGVPLAYIHLLCVKSAHRVVALNSPMADQISSICGQKVTIIENFIDEKALEHLRKSIRNQGAYKFIFVGSLTLRKQPIQVIRAIGELVGCGMSVSLSVIGAGPEEFNLRNEIKRLNLDNLVTLHGFLDEPSRLIAESDVLVLPSISEGTSRAAMEALFLGIPCVLRDIDGNHELISHGGNGVLYEDDRHLAVAMIHAGQLARNLGAVECLLPAQFRQDTASRKYLEIIGEHQYD